jgi:hypothetical protein
MRKVRALYRVMAFVCLAVSLYEMYRGVDVTILWITYWGMMIMSEVTR